MRHPGSNPGWVLIRFFGDEYKTALVLDGAVALIRSHGTHRKPARQLDDYYRRALEAFPGRQFQLDDGNDTRQTPAYSPDVTVDGSPGDTLFLVTPVSDSAKRWVDEFVNLESWQWLGSGFGVEHRYISDLVDGMTGDGLTVLGGAS